MAKTKPSKVAKNERDSAPSKHRAHFVATAMRAVKQDVERLGGNQSVLERLHILFKQYNEEQPDKVTEDKIHITQGWIILETKRPTKELKL